MKKTYEITFWTEPTKCFSGREETRVFKARSRSEAIYDAEDTFPNWAIIRVIESKKENQKVV